jgi:pimeloyl-ACP methyl ester carboxylesterase
LFGPEPVLPDMATKGGGLLSLRPRSFCGASCDIVAIPEDLPRMAERYPSITKPVGVIYGTEDRILDYKVHGEALATKLPGLDLELVEGGGHMLPLTSPDRCAGFIRRMAQRIPHFQTITPCERGDTPA